VEVDVSPATPYLVLVYTDECNSFIIEGLLVSQQ